MFRLANRLQDEVGEYQFTHRGNRMRRTSALIYCLLVFFVTVTEDRVALAQARSQPVLDVASMDTSVDPCSDFFTYSCGSWIKENPIPPDQTSWSVYSKLEDDNKSILREILESSALPAGRRDALTQKIGDYYAACMDEKAINDAAIKPLQPLLNEIEQMHSKRDIASVAAAMVSTDALFRFRSDQDFKDATQVIAEADQGGLGLPDRDYYLKTDAKSVELRKAYVNHLQKMFELLGDKPAAAAAEAQTVMRIETALAKGSLTRVEQRDPKKLYHKMTTQRLSMLSPSFQWKVYFENVGLPSVEALNVQSPVFFKALNAELQKETLASWKTYLRWHLINANAPFLSSDFVNADFDFFGKTLRGAQELQPRWKRCVGFVDNDLGEALGQAYVARTFSPDAKERAQRMVKEIEDAMAREIDSLPWMTPATKQRALEKLHAVTNKIGYPDKWRDYRALTIARDDEMGNVLRAREFEFHRQLAKIGKPVDRGEWQMTPPTVNAYYDPQMNDINFPAGVLQPPLFDPKMDDAPNYGNTGATIGHELTHGFDDEGRQFDARGNLKDWWTPKDAQQFEQRAACVVHQYAQFKVVDDIKINSKLTEGEDVADLGGTLLAYMAWKSATRGKDLKPIGGFSPDQRFFIGMAQWACGDERPESKRLGAVTNPHSPLEYRINGVVSNMPEFQKAFACKAGQPMVRAQACRVW